jgi:flagellar hook-associated protein 3 FlgL
MTSSVSALGLQLFSTASLQAEQTSLAQLNAQVGTGQQYSNLTDYSPLDAEQLINFQNAITQRQAYISSMDAVNARLQVYNNTMGDMENIASQAQQLATQNPSLNPDQTGNIQQQVLSYMNQVVDDLNQQVGNRYIYAGTRYSTPPVNLDAVLNDAPPASLVASPDLPPYDSEYNPPTTTSDPNAWTQDSVTIDAGFNVQYGATSTQTGFQQLIAGMQYINAATQTGVSAATYQADMSQAGTLLTSALTNIQTYNTGIAAATNTLTQEQTTQNQDIANLQIQIGTIQNVDLAQVGTELNVLQTQLQASYSATAVLTQDSILKYL